MNKLNLSTYQPRYFRDHFNDLDELNEALGDWHIDYRQLEPGGLDATIIRIECGPVTLTSGQFNRRVDQSGEAPNSSVSFGIMAGTNAVTRFCGHDVDLNSVIAFTGDGGGYEGNTPANAILLALTIDESFVQFLSDAHKFENPMNELRGRHSVRHCNATQVEFLRKRMLQLCSDFASQGKDGIVAINHELTAVLPSSFMMTILSSVDNAEKTTSRRRLLALQHAVQFIRENSARNPSIAEVCENVGVSWRTLNYAFREYYSVSPKNYLMTARLIRARRALRNAAPGEKVSDIANRLEFWHLGKFASDYKKHFGELPSRTLALSRAD